jgi:hypothetical protein
MIMRYWKAIAVKAGCSDIKDVMIRPGGSAVAMVIHVLELCNLILVFIWNRSRIGGCAIGNCKGVKGGQLEAHRLCMGCRILPMNQGEPDKSHYPVEKGICIQPQPWENASRQAIGDVSCLTWPGQGQGIVWYCELSQDQIVCTQASCQWCLDDRLYFSIKMTKSLFRLIIGVVLTFKGSSLLYVAREDPLKWGLLK